MFSWVRCLGGLFCSQWPQILTPQPLCPIQLPQEQGERGRPRGLDPRDTTNRASCPASQLPQFHGAHLEPFPPIEEKASVCVQTFRTQKVLRERDTGASRTITEPGAPPPHLGLGNDGVVLNLALLQSIPTVLSVSGVHIFSCPFGFTPSFYHYFYPYLLSLLEPFSLLSNSFKQLNSLIVTDHFFKSLDS